MRPARCSALSGFSVAPASTWPCSVQPEHIIQETEKLRVSECLPTRALTAEEQDALAGFRLWEANHPVHPFRVEGEGLPEPELRRLLADWGAVWDAVWGSVWDSVWASVGGAVWDSVGDSVRGAVWDAVGDSVRDAVGDSVGDSVWDSVWAYTGSLFPGITTWRGTDLEHPWDSLRALWLAGYVPSFDGKVWRLHRGPNAEVVLTVPKAPT